MLGGSRETITTNILLTKCISTKTTAHVPVFANMLNHAAVNADYAIQEVPKRKDEVILFAFFCSIKKQIHNGHGLRHTTHRHQNARHGTYRQKTYGTHSKKTLSSSHVYSSG